MRQKIKIKSKVSVVTGLAICLLVISGFALAAGAALSGSFRGSQKPVQINLTYVVDEIDLSRGGADSLPDGSCKSEESGGGTCSLREAIEQANISGAAVNKIDIILPSATMTLSLLDQVLQGQGELQNISRIVNGGDIDIITTKPVYIYGKCSGGSSLSEVSAAGLGERIFDMTAGTNVNISCVKFTGGIDDVGGAIKSVGGNLNISGSHFLGNSASDNDGGAIYVSDGLNILIDNSFFEDNEAIAKQGGSGGAVYFYGSTKSIQISNSDFEDNAAYLGGAVSDYASQSLVISNSSFNGNFAHSYGGALDIYSPYSVIFDSYFEGNSSNNGGAIHAGGNLVVNNSTFSTNEAIGNGPGGGAISFTGDDITINNSEISNNKGCYGGGLYISGANLNLSDSVIEENESAQTLCATSGIAGGGIFVSLSSVVIENSSIISNVTSGNGGGSFLLDSSLIASNSNISSNQAVSGGGIFSQSGNVSLINCTLFDNQVSGSYSAVGKDSDYNPIINISNCTISNNIGYGAVTSGVNFKGTILYNNLYSNGTTINCFPPVFSLGYNIDGDLDGFAGCQFNTQGDLSGVDPLFATGVLANNGGDTQTVALSANSPGKDAIPAADCTDLDGNPIPTDQRWVTRANGGTTGTGCDMGAYEYEN